MTAASIPLWCAILIIGGTALVIASEALEAAFERKPFKAAAKAFCVYGAVLCAIAVWRAIP